VPVDTVLHTEVCVVGGGPAGSAVARRLALLGRDVCLIERAAFSDRRRRLPRPESLSPGLLDLLGLLGLRERVEGAGFLPAGPALVRWSGGDDPWTRGPAAPGLLVDRGRFDRILWDAAAESGVRTLRPARVSRPRREEEGWRIPVLAGGAPREVRARLLVDAAGRSSVLGGRKRRYAPPLVALHGRWSDQRADDPATRVEAGPDEWLWGAPLPDGTFSALAFLEPDRCAAAGKAGLEGLYRSLLARSSLLRDCLKGRLLDRVHVCDASSYRDDRPADEGSIKIGEAAFTLDPLSSQGVQAAVQTALQGSVVLHTLLSCPTHAAAAIELCRSRQTEAVDRHARLAARAYGEQSLFPDRPFWRRRAAPPAGDPPRPLLPRDAPDLAAGTRLRIAGDARLVLTPCIQGDLVVPLRALEHPGLERPVAFLGGVELAPLLDALPAVGTASEALWRWAERAPAGTAADILRWMWRNRILVAAG
jgi:flavin-dependent dehydrogenase